MLLHTDRPPTLLRKGVEYVVAGFAYLAAAAAFYWPVLFGNATFPVDLPDYDYPRFFFLAKWIHQFVIPMWDPHVGFGMPVAGIMASQTFYPPLYFALWLSGAAPGVRAVEWFTVSHLAWGALGTYVLCRALRLAPAASFSAGFLFAFGGFFSLRLFHGEWVDTAVWFPFALAAWVRFLDTRRLRYAAWLSAIFLVMMVAGFWQQVMYSMYFVIFWGAWETARLFTAGNRTRRAILPVGVALVACAAGLLCDSSELLPTYEYAKHAAREKLTYEDSASYGLRGSDVPAILWAGMFTGKDGEALWNARRVNSGIRDYYPGTMVLVLLAYNLWLLVRRPERNQMFLWAALILFTAASFGSLTPVFWLLYKFAPGFSFFRRSGSLYYFAVLAAAVLCAYSLTDVVKRAGAWRFPLIAGVIPLVLYVALGQRVEARGALLYFVAIEVFALALLVITHFPARASLAVYLLAGVCLGDLYYFHGRQFAFYLRDYQMPQVDSIPQLAASPGDPYRVAIAPFNGPWDNLGEIAGFENPGGYMMFRPQRYQSLFQRIQSPDSPLLAEANARYLLTSPGMFREGLRRGAVAPIENRVQIPSGMPANPPYVPAGSFPENLRLFRNTDAVPRYYFSSSTEIIPDVEKQLDRMSDASFARRRAAVLEENLGVAISDCAADPVTVVRYSPNVILLDVVAHSNCLLVAGDSYHPGWRAYVDGVRTNVFLANVVFRASIVPAGKHVVEFRFEPAILWLGMAISAVAGVAIIAFLFFFRRLV